MMASAGTHPSAKLAHLVEVRPIGIDHFSGVRYLHATALLGQYDDGLSQADAEAFIRLVYSPAYADLLIGSHVLGAWYEGELVGTSCWEPVADEPATARFGPVVVGHPHFGIGRLLFDKAEADARSQGMLHFTAWTTANAVPFFEHLGYRVASRGVKVLSPDCTLPVTYLRKPPVLPPSSPPPPPAA